jgi:drug/metabolite transporter (DMT)-like permease
MTHASTLPNTLSKPFGTAGAMPLVITAFCLLWSASFVAGKVGVTNCPPLILLTVRFLAAGLLILAFAAVRGGAWNLSRRDVVAYGIIGIANNALYLGLGYVGLQTISAGLNSLIVSANPVFVTLLSAAALGERITWRKVLGLMLAMAGVALIVAHRISSNADSPIGIVYSVAALASLVAGTVLFKLLAPKGSLLVGNGIQNISGGLAALPFALTFENAADIHLNAHLFGALAYLILLGSIAGYLLWFRMLTTLGASAASAYHFVMPALGMLFGWLLLGEHVSAQDMTGIVPVALGIYLVTRPTAAA